ncbi:helix-turn-helix domain-containing protein [Paenibacillus lentus]|uniref:helix-turn-helix domain-containing protein n=1 Tax=Paenibacillus lentus TaxID=1338368 RepID=UPI00364F925C
MSDDTMLTELMLTLEAARINCGYTLVEAAKKFNIHRDTLWKYEQDSTRVSRTFMLRVYEVYGIPKEQIFFGKKSEFFRIRNKMSAS